MKLPYNKTLAFMDSKGHIRLIAIVKKGKSRMIQALKQDTIASIENFPVDPRVPYTGYFFWPYSAFKQLIEKDWELLGPL